MDYLSIVQRWPETRKMMIRNQKGFLSIIVWTHHILNLSVLVRGLPGGDLSLMSGDSPSPQVIISWTFDEKAPEVFLLDSQMVLVLKTGGEEIELSQMDACERLPLQGFGTVTLQREFNLVGARALANPLLKEAVQPVAAMATLIVKKLARFKGPNRTISSSKLQDWQILNAGDLIFHNVQVDQDNVNAYLQLVRNSLPELPPLRSLPIPPALDAYLKKQGARSDGLLPVNLRLMRLAVFVAVIASIQSLDSCAGLPLIADVSLLKGIGFVNAVQRQEGPVAYSPSDMLNLFCQMLVGLHFVVEEQATESRSFMVSDFGWTVFYQASEITTQQTQTQNNCASGEVSLLTIKQVKGNIGCVMRQAG
jgi:hypothetical protein